MASEHVRVGRPQSAEPRKLRAEPASAQPEAMVASEHDAAVPSTVGEMLAWQSTIGNSAVQRLVQDALGQAVQRQFDAPSDAASGNSVIAQLAQTVGTPGGLRRALMSNPQLAQQIATYFAAGNEDPALNSLMTGAFPPAYQASETDGQTQAPGKLGEEKSPKDPTLALPDPISGTKTLKKGTMTWTLKATSHDDARVDVQFTPDSKVVEASTISFVQTVLSQVGTKRAYAGGTATDPAKNKARYEPFEEPTSKKRVDFMPLTENDPFYGAEWDQAAKKWKQETADWHLGSSSKGGAATSASLYDTPGVAWAREGLGDQSIEFETVAVILETREPLGALKWGFKIKDAENAPIELTGAQATNCTDDPSESWAATLEQFYVARFAAILDNFDINKSDLKPDHKTKLDDIVTKMKANPALNAQLGGAADLTGNKAFNQALSLKRAEAVRAYLVDKGIDAARLEVQNYGFDWARVEQKRGKSEGKNRRVQIWLH
jgi:outer membrane protein OmpA-like peptidoglycan-associated protein